MKKTLPIIIIAAVVLLLGFYLMANRGMKNKSTSTTEQEQAQNVERKTFVGSLKEAVSFGIALKCTYEVEGNQYEGYIKGENYRGEMASAEGQIAHVIVKDNCMWTWEEGATEGVKTCYDDVEAMETDETMMEEEESSSVWDQSQGSGISYTCTQSAVNDSMFEPPTEVTFMDLNTMMEGMMGQ
jgi:hypothetical protein